MGEGEREEKDLRDFINKTISGMEPLEELIRACIITVCTKLDEQVACTDEKSRAPLTLIKSTGVLASVDAWRTKKKAKFKIEITKVLWKTGTD